MSSKKSWATGGHSAQPKYGQFDHNGFKVGCGPVAWAMLIAWADRQAAKQSPYWKHRWGLYRQNGGTGADATAPLHMTGGVRNMIRELHRHVRTFNLFGSGATTPWDMRGVAHYLAPRTWTRSLIRYNSIGISEDGLRDRAANCIKYRKCPAVIGTGWLNHYPVAYGYRETKRIVRGVGLFYNWRFVIYSRSFYVNQGWHGFKNDWIAAQTWFCGELFPH